MIRECEYVSVSVGNLPESVRFYRDVIGLRLLFEYPDRWAEFELGRTRLALYPSEPGEVRGGEIGLLVDDLAQEMARLKEKGVDFPCGPEKFNLPTGSGRLARFRDPSGNKLELVERS